MKPGLSVLLFLAGLCSLACCLPQYHFINTTLTWAKAQAYCREQDADLATVFSVEDMKRLVAPLEAVREKAWIGLRDNLTSWRWSFSNSSYYRDQEGNYRNWYYGQPDNFLGDQMCTMMWSGGVWQDTQCFLKNPFICYDGSKIPDLPFVFVERELSWSDAQLYCRKYHTDLASVRNERENKEIQLLANKQSVWIGLYRTREWSDKCDSSYRYWQQGQPDNVGEKQECVAADLGNGGLWSDEECNRELVFICYIDSAPEEPVLSTTTTTTETPDTDSATTKTSSNEIPNQPNLVTTATTETPNRTTTIDGDLRRTEMTSSEPPSTPLMDPTTSTPVIPDQRTTTETETTTSHLSTAIASSEQPSTPEEDQTRPVTDETPTEPASFSTVTASTSNKITTVDGDLRRTEMTSSTSLVDPTTSTPEVSSHQYSTPEGGQTRSKEHVMNMRVKFTSRVQLSEDDMEKLFHDLLIEMGLPTSIKVGLKRQTVKK